MTAKILSFCLLGTLVGCAPSTSTTEGSHDLSPALEQHDMATQDSASIGDMAMAPSCGSIEAYCGNASNLCVSSWTDAQKASSWCKPGVTVDIYITTAPCGAGYNGVSLVSSTASPPGKQFFYATSGALASVSTYDPDGSGDATCVAGPTNLPNMISGSGCAFANPVSCVDGVIQ